MFSLISKFKLVFVFIIFVVIGVVIFNFIKTKYGDFRPALTPNLDGMAKKLESNGPLKLPPGFQISIFAEGLGKPRDLAFSPQGTLLASIPSSGKVVALIDQDADGKAEEIKTILNDLDNPHGLVFYEDYLFVASEKSVRRYVWNEKGKIVFPDKLLFNLPAGDRHNTRTLEVLPSSDNSEPATLFVSIGSTCDVCFEKNSFLASVIISDTNGRAPKLFAKGLRNAVFIKINPQTGKLWGTEMGRDFLGDDLPPDEINIINQDADYGWPICYGHQIYDTKFAQKKADYCLDTTSPVYEIQAHSAPLGLAFISSSQFPDDWQNDLLVAYHGSWNRSIPVGYKIVRLKTQGDRVEGEEDFITGFLDGARALGRPVDLEFAPNGDLYISDDKAGVVYLIRKIE